MIYKLIYNTKKKNQLLIYDILNNQILFFKLIIYIQNKKYLSYPK